MTKSTPSSRVAATAAALLGACLLSTACPVAALANAAAKAKTSSFEDQPLNLSSSASGAHSSSSGGASLVRTIVGLAIVLAVIWGLAWILRQVKAGRDPQAPSGVLETVAALTLASGRTVHLVKAGSEYLLLASAEHGLVPIHRYSEQEARAAGLLAAAPAPAPRRRFDALLKPPAETSGGHDPMRMPSPGPGTTLLERMRELTVRR